jgi:acyl-CoA thioesterase FadM
MSQSQMKTVIVTFFDISGTVHFEFIAQVQTVNQANYVEIMKWLVEAVLKKGMNFGPVIGFSTMTMLRLTGHSL